jgi:hypothetical protein
MSPVTLLWTVFAFLLVAYVPGALIFRLPIGDRQRRAGLAVEERAFWGVLLIVIVSSFATLGLAAAGSYG